MNFKEYWKTRDPDNYTGMSRVTARASWLAAMNSCAEMLEKEAAKSGKKAGEYALFENKIELLAEQTALLNAVILIRTEIANS